MLSTGTHGVISKRMVSADVYGEGKLGAQLHAWGVDAVGTDNGME